MKYIVVKVLLKKERFQMNYRFFSKQFERFLKQKKRDSDLEKNAFKQIKVSSEKSEVSNKQRVFVRLYKDVSGQNFEIKRFLMKI